MTSSRVVLLFVVSAAGLAGAFGCAEKEIGPQNACAGETPSYVYIRESNLHPVPLSTFTGVNAPGPLMPPSRLEPREVPPDSTGELAAFADKTERYVVWPEMALMDGFFTPEEIKCWADAGDQMAIMMSAHALFDDAGDFSEKITPEELARRRAISREYMRRAAALKCPEPDGTKLAASRYIFRLGVPIAHNQMGGAGGPLRPTDTKDYILARNTHNCVADYLGNPTPRWFSILPENCAELIDAFTKGECTP